MAKHKTTAQIAKERRVAAETRAEARRLQEIYHAKGVLCELKGMTQCLQGQNLQVLKHAVEALKDEIAYLIEESEHYRDAAAELFCDAASEHTGPLLGTEAPGTNEPYPD